MTDSEIEEKFKYLEPLHRRHSELLRYMDEFCSERGIVWCLADGSALGAARHSGPIPWDDDVDIIMPAADYDKFRAAFAEQGDHGRFYLQEKVNVDGMVDVPKLRMNNTTFIEPGTEGLDMHHGIYIDIFIVHNVPDSKLMRKICYFLQCFMELKTMADQGYRKRKLFIPLMALLRSLPRSFGMKTALKFLYKWDSRDCREVAHWFIHCKTFPRDIVFPVERREYDGMQLPVPHRLEEFLEISYGNWRQIPELSEIEWHLHAAKWDADRDFRNYVSGVNDFSFEMGKGL